MERIEEPQLSTVEIRLLGGVEAVRQNRTIDIGYPRQRMVLAALAAEVGRPVTTATLVEYLWDDVPPPSAVNTVQGYISRLRKLLDGVAIDRRNGAYVLRVDPRAVDLQRFRGHIDAARGAADDEARRRYVEAFDLWRGEPFTGFDTRRFDDLRHRLTVEFHRAFLDRNEVLLRLGEHDALAAELPSAVRARPLDERLVGQLMLALFRCGRQAEALEHHTRLRDRLVEELGNDPGPELAELHRRIIRGDAAAPQPATEATPPRQLPAAPRLFTAREAELDRLDAPTDPDGAPVWVISGPGGIGKTWTALNWANRRLDRFPDGQLYVNLHGFHPTEEPVSAQAALAQALDGLGVPATAIPAGTEARAAKYRSLLADKRMLILLDNARDAGQVRGLLPGGRTCTTIVTSRRELAGLAATHGARNLRLSRLTDDRARQVLARHLGEPRLDFEPAAVTELVEHCGGLPLALGLVGARAAAQEALPLAALAEELRDRANRLDLLDDDGLDIGLRAVFDGSLRALGPEETELFRLLGLVDGRDIGHHAVASLAGRRLGEVRVLLRRLETANLIEQYLPGRFRMHDLTRLYAAELAEVDEAALYRLIRHYLHTMARVDELLAPRRNRTGRRLGDPVTGCLPAPLTDREAARRWLWWERANLPSIQRLGIDRGRVEEGWLLAWYFTIVGWDLNQVDEVLQLWRGAFAVVDRLDEPETAARVEVFLGRSLHRAGRPAEGARHLDHTLDYFTAAGDHRGEYWVLRELCRCWEGLGDPRRALDFAQRALRLAETGLASVKPASALNAVGWCHASLGEFDLARTHCEKALRLLHEADVGTPTPADLWDSLGYIAHHSGRHTEAIDYYRRALAALEPGWSQILRPEMYERLGDSHHAAGAVAAAREAWRQSLVRYRSQHRTEAAAVVTGKLAASDDERISPS